MKTEQGMTIACRGCGRLMKYDGSHRRCGRCRYRLPPGGRSVKRVCPLCTATKAAKSFTCAGCLGDAIRQAKNDLREKVRNALPVDTLRYRQEWSPERQLHTLPRGYGA